jgi:hypothetical protein
MTSLEYAKALATRLSTAHARWGNLDVFGSKSNLRDRFVSQLAFALRGKPVTYVTVEYDAKTGSIAANAFTDSSVVWTSYDGETNDIASRVMSLQDVQGIQIIGAPNYFSDDSGGSTLVRARLTIDGSDFNLPGDEYASSANFEDLATFLPNLLP